MKDKTKKNKIYKIGDKVEVPGGFLTCINPDTGKRYENSGARIGIWKCIDNCPKNTLEFECVNMDITRKGISSCGCLKDRIIAEHNSSRVEEYIRDLWLNIKQRCYNENNKYYDRYGGRGIKMQEDWINDRKKFEKDLLEKLDHRPTKDHSLDRINNDLNYTIDNIKWSTDEEQVNNTSVNVFITINNISKSLSQWEKEYKLNNGTIARRQGYGWTGEKLIQSVKKYPEKTFDPEDLYRLWKSLKERTSDVDNDNYGGRGIKLYQPWKESYVVFKKDILDNIGGKPTKKHQLDRFPDNNGNYEPGNVRWATSKQYNRNRRTTVWIEYKGEKISLAEASEKSEIPYDVLKVRVRNKCPQEDLFLPATGRKSLNQEKVDLIRKLYQEDNITFVKLAEKYEVSYDVIKNVIRKRGAYTK